MIPLSLVFVQEIQFIFDLFHKHFEIDFNPNFIQSKKIRNENKRKIVAQEENFYK